jgi:hypothetical protein
VWSAISGVASPPPPSASHVAGEHTNYADNLRTNHIRDKESQCFINSAANCTTKPAHNNAVPALNPIWFTQ